MTPVAQGTGAPARCAGLRHALLNDWQRGFPLQASPFQVLARRLGGSLREVLSHCHALVDEGSLDGIHVQWSPALQRVRWRCGLQLEDPAAAPAEALRTALEALPGVTGYDRLEDDDGHGSGDRSAGPTLWFELAARHAEAARAQVAWFEARHGALRCLPLRVPSEPQPDAGHDCGCEPRIGPCGDPELARRCEAGLPLVAHPFRNLSESVHRSEREVLARLRGWQREGGVLSLGLGVAAAQGSSPGERMFHAASVTLASDDAALRKALLARPGIVDVSAMPGLDDATPALLVVATGSAVQADALVERALAACGLGTLPRRRLRLHRARWREAPLLFTDIGEPAASVRPT